MIGGFVAAAIMSQIISIEASTPRSSCLCWPSCFIVMIFVGPRACSG
jgi:hypothetical protein